MDRTGEIGQLAEAPSFRKVKKAARNLQALGARRPLVNERPGEPYGRLILKTTPAPPLAAPLMKNLQNPSAWG